MMSEHGGGDTPTGEQPRLALVSCNPELTSRPEPAAEASGSDLEKMVSTFSFDEPNHLEKNNESYNNTKVFQYGGLTWHLRRSETHHKDTKPPFYSYFSSLLIEVPDKWLSWKLSGKVLAFHGPGRNGFWSTVSGKSGIGKTVEGTLNATSEDMNCSPLREVWRFGGLEEKNPIYAFRLSELRLNAKSPPEGDNVAARVAAMLAEDRATRDVTLQAVSVQQAVHRLVLAAHSPTLADAFAGDPNLKVVDVGDVDEVTLELFTRWLYTGLTLPMLDHLRTLLPLASRLDVRPLKQTCEKLLTEEYNSGVGDPLELFQLARSCNCNRLLEAVKPAALERLQNELNNSADVLESCISVTIGQRAGNNNNPF